MGKKAEAVLEIAKEELASYLSANHSAYMQVDSTVYYLTDVNENYWRVQRTDQLNEKGHFTDCSELVPSVSEFLDLPFAAGQTINQLFDRAKFFASEK